MTSKVTFDEDVLRVLDRSGVFPLAYFVELLGSNFKPPSIKQWFDRAGICREEISTCGKVEYVYPHGRCLNVIQSRLLTHIQEDSPYVAKARAAMQSLEERLFFGVLT